MELSLLSSIFIFLKKQKTTAGQLKTNIMEEVKQKLVKMFEIYQDKTASCNTYFKHDQCYVANKACTNIVKFV